MNLFRCCMIAGAVVSALFSYSPESSAQMRLWGTFYGGTDSEIAGKAITDSAGNTFVIGTTQSATEIASPNAFDPFLDEPKKAFLAKFDTNGKLVWATYYGDGPATEGMDLGLDGLGNIYVIGTVACPSVNLATLDAHDKFCQGANDMFLARFNPQGKRVWGTYFGGTDSDSGVAVSVTSIGYVFVTGHTSSTQGLVPIPNRDTSYGGGDSDAVIAKFTPRGTLMWARYLGGPGIDLGFDIACEEASLTAQCYVTGSTESATGIASDMNVYDPELSGGRDSFLAKVDGVSGQTLWSTYYGGNGSDIGKSVAARGSSVFIGGDTSSSDAMSTENAHDENLSGEIDMFLARFTPDGWRQVGTYYGQIGGQNELRDLAIDLNSNIYVLGETATPMLEDLATPNAYDTQRDGPTDAVVAKFNQVLTRLWSTYYGGSEYENTSFTGGVTVGTDGHVHVFGGSTSPDALATPGAHKIFNPGNDVFLAEFWK